MLRSNLVDTFEAFRGFESDAEFEARCMVLCFVLVFCVDVMGSDLDIM